MYSISLKNNKSFNCDSNTTIFEAAKKAGIVLEHSCLKARCRSCIVKVLSGQTKNIQDELVLSESEIDENFVLSCNALPLSNLTLDVEDLNNLNLFNKKITPVKINLIERINENVIKVILRFPPKSDFKYNPGQYVNIKKGNLSRSYSIANYSKGKNNLEFFIKNYSNGKMSKYWFEEAKLNDLLMIEGPMGSFFLREFDNENIIFLATGTGISPIKAILENISENHIKIREKKIWVFEGARYDKDLLWEQLVKNINIQYSYVPVLSRQKDNWIGDKGYVQDALLKKNINLKKTQVYACGSINMIKSARKLLIQNSLSKNSFFSDAFIPTK